MEQGVQARSSSPGGISGLLQEYLSAVQLLILLQVVGKGLSAEKKCISNSLLYINEVKGEVLPEALMANVVLGSLFWFGDSSVSLAQEMSGCKAGQVLLAVQSKTIQLLWKNYRVCAEADI